MYKDKVLLITGGTGSFGNAVLHKFLKSDINEIRILSRDEKKQDDMRLFYNNSKIKFYLGDVRDINSVNNAMSGVNFVFHAAALKQVPSCEFYPIEAVKTNILGAENVLNSALSNQVEKVVVLSTDKAVYPINAMGLSKAMMEKLMVAKSRSLNAESKMVFCATRYGNVMGSRGSVIPLFIQQIKSGNPITITEPSMTRFMMSLTDSVNLVEFAFENAKPGDIFVQKSPASTVLDVAKALKIIFKADNPIKTIGIRHGEKIYETLCNREEMAKAEDMGDFYRVPADNRDLNYAKFLEDGEPKYIDFEDYHSHNTTRLGLEGTIDLLLKLDIVQEALKQ
ncbi:polysaccharide biosynthesis protein [Pedobacter kyonggii]|uniref:UDP-glucose 4-epimerase n=1 Tax=Pedobacter kyonggii TaxID=1926871 RepID=A0A4Q9HES8_9SPHI|nr:polysaccharide biosynthesis protein [Pedobacter kyonggii]TBO43304.1 NAD-dependent epimerase/dehydratase family protein [Pedobacter kyonggii]